MGATGKFSGKACGKKDIYEERDITARYLLVDLADNTKESDLHDYFSTFGDIEEAIVKRLETGKVVGSVKFFNPTLELRNIMLREMHVIRGMQLKVETWKMRKQSRPGLKVGKGNKSGPLGGDIMAYIDGWDEFTPSAGYGPIRSFGAGAYYYPYGKWDW